MPNTKTAIRVLQILAQYDLFLGDGESKPLDVRRQKRLELVGQDHWLNKVLQAYDVYQQKRCSGVSFVTNMQGCQKFEHGEWRDLEGMFEKQV